MNNKRVPPSVAQSAVSERAELLARIAELGVTIARLESQLSRAIQANYDLRTKLVVPSPDALGRAFITCESSDAGYRVVIKSERMQEAQQLHNWLAHLNAAPAAPAADAGLVEAFCKVEQALDLIGGIRHGKNVTQDELWQSCELLDAALVAHRAKGVV